MMHPKRNNLLTSWKIFFLALGVFALPATTGFAAGQNVNLSAMNIKSVDMYIIDMDYETLFGQLAIACKENFTFSALIQKSNKMSKERLRGKCGEILGKLSIDANLRFAKSPSRLYIFSSDDEGSKYLKIKQEVHDDLLTNNPDLKENDTLFYDEKNEMLKVSGPRDYIQEIETILNALNQPKESKKIEIIKYGIPK
jgi:hypothetical protein